MDIVYQDDWTRIIRGEAEAVLSELPDNSVQMTMTSPPYFQQRNNKISGQIGIETDLDAYLDRLMAVFAQVQQVLDKRGSLFLNIDDVYGNTYRRFSGSADGIPSVQIPLVSKSRSKGLMLVPERLIIKLSQNGWLVRNKIVWSPDNAEPESVQDRFSHQWEPIYWLTRQAKYYSDLDAVRVKQPTWNDRAVPLFKYETTTTLPEREDSHLPDQMPAMKKGPRGNHPNGKNPGDVWRVNIGSNRLGHRSAFPEGLCRLPILVSTRPGDTVLDPFGGSGTVGAVAKCLGRRAILVDIDPRNCQKMIQRLQAIPLPFEITAGEDLWRKS